MRNSLLVSTVLCGALLLASPAPAQAALAQSQIDAVLALLAAFGADNAVIQNVRVTLTGSAATTGTSGSLQFAPGTLPPALQVKPNTKSIPFTTIALYNNTGAPVTLYTFVVERSGSSSDANLGTISLMSGNTILASAHTLDERHQARLPANLVLAPGEHLNLTVVADISARKSSNKTVQLDIVALNTSSPILGALPVAGTKHTIR